MISLDPQIIKVLIIMINYTVSIPQLKHPAPLNNQKFELKVKAFFLLLPHSPQLTSAANRKPIVEKGASASFLLSSLPPSCTALSPAGLLRQRAG